MFSKLSSKLFLWVFSTSLAQLEMELVLSSELGRVEPL